MSNQEPVLEIESQSKTSRRADWIAVLFVLIFPTIGTIIYFVGLDGLPPTIQKVGYSAVKVLQFGFPAVWVVFFQKHIPRGFLPTKKRLARLGEGAAFGIAVFGATVALHWLWLSPIGFLTSDAPIMEGIHSKVEGFGLDTPARYIAFLLFVSLIHSLMEEYYWRWFAFGQLKRLVSVKIAIPISAAGFAAHHVIVLAYYFGWTSPATWLFSLGVGIGGAYWAWLYHRTGSLYASWLSHAIIDVAIFVVGYNLLFG
jgi:uncharacterized protein